MRKQSMVPVNIRLIKVGVVCISLLCSGVAFSAPPDAGVILNTVKPSPMPTPTTPPESLISAPEEVRPAMQEKPGMRVMVEHVRFAGVTAFPEQVLQDIVAKKIGRELSFAELTDIAGLITKYYRDHGYLVARAYIPEQPLTNNTIEIFVLEGKLGVVKPNFKTVGPKISDERLKGFVNGEIPEGGTITVPALERALLLENELPNLKATATMVPGASVGTSDLVLEANQLGRFYNDTLEVDNSGSRYTGSARYGASVNLASPLGLGDQLSARVITSFDGFNYGRVSWTTPVGNRGLKGGVAATYSDYTLGGPYKAGGLKGNSEISSLFAVYPYIRTRYFNLYQTVNVDNKRLYDTSNAGVNDDKRVNDLSFGVNGDDFDGWMGGGLSTFSATLTMGDLDLSNDPTNAMQDSTTARTAGSYQKLLLQAMRQQHLTDNWVLYGSATDQMSSKNLDSSESLSFGGPTAVRAYPVGEAPADEGLLATVELRYNTVAPQNMGALQYQLFYDYGGVQLHHTQWAAGPNNYNLQGVGLGMNVYKENAYMLNAALAHKIGSNPNPGTGGTDADGRSSMNRFWVQLAWYW
jgi:hemolysin activation/secretion protein